jgi:hypothetical protein
VSIFRVLEEPKCISVCVYLYNSIHRCGTFSVLQGVKGFVVLSGIPAHEIYMINPDALFAR